MMRRVTRVVAVIAGVAALAAWFGARPAAATDWPGPYDIDGGRWYSEEARDYRRLGYDNGEAERTAGFRPFYVGSVYSPTYPYAATTSDYYYGAYSPAQDNAARIRLIVPAD